MTTKDLEEANSFENLSLAWKRLQTTTDRKYKDYFRSLYRAYSLSEEKNLRALSEKLKKQQFTPQHSVKIYLPKSSGILRPFTLLCIEDQIVYQAYANIVAKYLYKKKTIRDNAGKIVFGHIFTNPSDEFFFVDWKKSYKKFASKFINAVENGFHYTASFDLTACYDSIDHTILLTLLRKLGHSEQFTKFLINMLKTWTITGLHPDPMPHGHGIPQGPAASGILSEIILSKFEPSKTVARTKYFRYVDDIRLLAKSERELRRQLINLDLKSKSLALFPQSSKIDIHKVKKPANELKSISNLDIYDGLELSPKKVQTEFINHSLRLNIKDPTKFNYLLGKIKPSISNFKRALRILNKYPHHFLSITRFFEKFSSLTEAASKSLLEELKGQELYFSVRASLLNSTRKSIHHSHENEVAKFAKGLTSDFKYKDTNLKAAAFSFLFSRSKTPWKEIEKWLSRDGGWWVISQAVPHLQWKIIGEASQISILNKLICSNSEDLAIVGAELLITKGGKVTAKLSKINPLAQNALKAAGLIKVRRNSQQCPIETLFSKSYSTQLRGINWKFLLGGHYEASIKLAVAASGYSSTDSTAWTNSADSFNDLLLDQLFNIHEEGLVGKYDLGYIGSILNQKSRFSRKYPSLFKAIKMTHDLRLRSLLSHAKTKQTKEYTGYVEYKEAQKARKLLVKGFLELWELNKDKEPKPGRRPGLRTNIRKNVKKEKPLYFSSTHQ